MMGNRNSSDDIVLIYATFSSQAEAERICGSLVDRKLIACANIFAAMTSIYNWQGQRQRDTETAAVLKTRSSLATRVVAEIKALHSYTNPAIVVLPVSAGSPQFLDWIAAETANPEPSAAT